MKVENLLSKDFKISGREQYILESFSFLKEISLSKENAIILNKGSGVKRGSFSVDNITYNYGFSKLPSSILFPGTDVELEGNTWNASFKVKGDKGYKVSNFLPKQGRAPLIKIYSTLYKVIIDFLEKEKPDNLLISSYEKSGYFRLYSQLTKTNKIQSYRRMSTVNWKIGKETINSIILTKY